MKELFLLACLFAVFPNPSNGQGKKKRLESQRQHIQKKLAGQQKNYHYAKGEKSTTSRKLDVAAAKRKNVAMPDDYSTLNSSEKALDASFEKSKGKLPWPVEHAIVSVHFGVYTDEITHVKGRNPGITISTRTGSTVKSIFNGHVTNVFNMDDAFAVMVQHGSYFTVYSNLSSVNVARGTVVTKGDVIGRAALDIDGRSKIDLLLMKGKENIDPDPWLIR
ncbi:MAG TPA: peptidoglycan DD-metalloendopeptidase family protein [Chitinophagaceae bacterium]|jgi:murein hydrolase activator|nr:peptidoglycan DD-metalloendopeptidase family protein [Chitinophagaceae bacterium]